MMASGTIRQNRLRRDQALRRAFEAGIPVTKLAARRGKSRTWVYQRLNAMGCLARNKSATSEEP
jgi:hypothetical protein